MSLRRSLPLVPLALAAVLACPVPARAGRFGVEAQAGYLGLNATQSAKAVFDGSTGGATYGGALRYVLWKGLFLSAGARTFSKDGERVFVASSSGPVAKLGFPLSVRITPIFGTVGYRFREGRSFVPYLGVGGGSTKFKETSDVAGDVREDSRSNASFHALAGVEYGTGFLRFGAEGVYSSVSDAIGIGGVSKVYNEKNLGGFSILGKLVVSFGK